MKRLSVFFIFIILICLLFTSACSREITLEKRFLGKWQVEDEKDTFLYLSEDGHLYVRNDKHINTTYKITEQNELNRKITCRVMNLDTKEEMIWSFTFSEDYKKMTLESKKEGTVKFLFIDGTQTP
ncbi:hypothetical protein KAU33_00155 [Candidatus Dependentiae bacterium]|nr:hypothetical protein [Candidatus Dependentiae bacterium]